MESKILIRNIHQRILFHHNPDFGALSIFAAASFARFSASVLFWDTLSNHTSDPKHPETIYTVSSW